MAQEIAEVENMRRVNEENSKFTCRICFEKFEQETDVYLLELCEHVFHEECMTHYIHS